MVALTACCMLFALMSALGAMWSLALLLLGSLVAAHVLGNSLGTRLRDGATHEIGVRPPITPLRGPEPSTAPSGLTLRTRLSRLAVVASLVGGMVGAMLGGTGSAALYPEAGGGAVALGVVSAAVLGTFVGFALSSFLLVLRAAWREALREPPQR